ncbi:MAG: hypothetical protein ACUVUD_07580 [bacterium]
MRFSAIVVANAAVLTIASPEEFFNNLGQIEFQNVQLPATGAIKLAPAATPLCSLEEPTIWQIVADRYGTLYLGTGEKATLYRYSLRQPHPTPVWSGHEGTITALAITPDRTLYWGTTPQGTIYRLHPGAEIEQFAATDATYIFALLFTPDRSLLCATGPDGKLLQLFPDGRQKVIFTAPQAHLTTLQWLKEGKELLIGTSPDGIVYRLTFSTRNGKPSVTTFYDTPLNEIRALANDGKGNIYLAANSDEPAQSALFCVDTNGILRWQWLCPDSVIFNLYYTKNQLLVLTGNRGIVYSLDTIGKPTVLAQLDATQLLAFSTFKDNLYIGSGNSARLYRLSPSYSDSGYITSRTFDFSNPARFGRLTHFARIPPGTELLFATRSGNSEKPDSTWSPWQPVRDKVNSPPARFLQWQAKLLSRFPNLTPELERVEIYYAAVNRPPLISRLEIASLPETEARKGNSQPRRTVSWDVSDPDDDSLIFQLFIAPAEEYRWHLLAKDLTGTSYDLDTRTLPDGWYRLRLVASDHVDRPANSALTHEYQTPPFIVDNTPPVITGLKVSRHRAEWKVTDLLSTIVSCRVSVNAGPWLPIEPRDGIFDSPDEVFSCPIESGSGRSTIAVWAIDASGNSTTVQTFFNR